MFPFMKTVHSGFFPRKRYYLIEAIDTIYLLNAEYDGCKIDADWFDSLSKKEQEAIYKREYCSAILRSRVKAERKAQEE